MDLPITTIRDITCGAVRVEQEEKGIRFYRFTRDELNMYQVKNKDFALKALTTAGMWMRFRTDSKSLRIRVQFEHPIGRQFFSVDVFVNGNCVGYVDNFRQEDMPRKYFELEFPEGIYEKEFSLEEENSLVEICLPWNGVLTLLSLQLEDGSSVEPAKPAKKMLIYGDSITQGYDAMRPSNRYAGRIAGMLGAEEFNKAIGGECFWPELAEQKVDFTPDYILVGYGTNDWNKTTRQTLVENAKAFYDTLARVYPEVPIFALTPIWRVGAESRVTKVGPFDDVEPIIRNAVTGLEQVTVLRGIDFVPHDINCFSDLGLHPNDTGFKHYADNLWSAIIESKTLRDRH